MRFPLLLACVAIGVAIGPLPGQTPDDTYFSLAVVDNGHNHSGANKLFLDFQSAPFSLPDASTGTVVSREVGPGAIVLDGDAIDWDPANTLTFTGLVQSNHPLSEFLDAQPTVIHVNSVWDANDIYFLVQWQDAGLDASVRKDKWIYGDQGSGETGWNKQVHTGAAPGTPNALAVNAHHRLAKTESEDRVFFMFPIVDVAGNFTDAGRGCATYCHGYLSEQTSYTNYNGAGLSVMHTDLAGDRADIWHWKATRTEPSGFADDKHIGDPDPLTRDGRRSDAGTSAYSNNDLGSFNPTFMHITGLGYLGDILFDLESMPYSGTPQPGHEMPRYVSRAPAGFRADVQTAASFDPATGMWTLEVRRALDTGDVDDHIFTGASPASPPTHALIQSGDPLQGEQLFDYNCIGCHQAQGAGMQARGAWAFPRIQRASASMIHSAFARIPMMTVFQGQLSDQDVADIASYLQQQETFRPSLAVTDLIGGLNATLTAGEAQAGDTVYFAYSLNGTGPTATPWGFSLDLGAPYSQVGAATAGVDGSASISVAVPSIATGLHVWIQAVVHSGSSLQTSWVVDQYVQ